MLSFTVGLIFSIILFSIYTGIINNKETSISFEKKQKCQNLQSEIEKRLKETYTKPLYENVELDDLFYSIGRDTCVYAYRVWSTGEISKPSFYLEDALTNEKLFEIWLFNEDDIKKQVNLIDKFDEIIKKYKDPKNSLNDLPISEHLIK